MATQTSAKSGSFLDNLGKIYGLYTGGFFAFVILLAILEQLGMDRKLIGYGFVFLTLAVYAIIGILSRTMQAGEYYVAGRSVPAFYNGMATGSDWMSAASFIGMAGNLYLQGYDGLAFVLGWTGGYVLVAILIAPFLRKFGAYTVPDFFSERYGGGLARFLAVIVLIVCSFTYVVAQIRGTGLIAQQFLDMDYNVAVYVGLGGILLCSMLGGMKAVTWTQVAQYIVLIIAYLTPVIILSAKKFSIPVPQLTYGSAIEQITALEQSMLKAGLADPKTLKAHATPFLVRDQLNYFLLILCLMVGTASLPHILMRYFTTPSVKDARRSVAWSLFFIFLLYFTAPAYAAFAKLEVYTLINKKVAIADLAKEANWLFTYGKYGLVKICGANATGVDAVVAACQKIAGHGGFLRHQDLAIHADSIVLSPPEIAKLPYVITGLVAAGGLAAALSTADGLLLAIANALSHDLYYKMIAPNSSTSTRLILARILLLVVAVAAAWCATWFPPDILILVSWAFSLAAAGIFPALVLGVWWKGATTVGAVLGMIAGFSVTGAYMVGTHWYKWPLWFGISNLSAGFFGLVVGFATIFVVSLFTKKPSEAVQAIDATRRPRGDAIIKDKDAEVAH